MSREELVVMSGRATPLGAALMTLGLVTLLIALSAWEASGSRLTR